ncbi:MAG: ATP synthase F1 subunit gamma [Bacteroidales bacterium]|jgi:F-type H+-transporting ATPase subunit gamma|nr:ATP synthase F1 subunit gamma [Bacteroidales bacterium]
MSSLKEIKNRIHSVQSTRKITSAMKMVSMAKLNKTERIIGSIHSFYHHLHDILKVILEDGKDYQTEFSEARELKRIALVIFSSNSSLCGSFNSNITKRLNVEVQNYTALGHDNILVIPIGKKIARETMKMGYKIPPGFENLDFIIDKPDVNAVLELANQLKQLYLGCEVDKVELIYHHAKSKGSQILDSRTLLPLDLKERDVIEKPVVRKRVYEDDFIIEPDRENLLHDLVPWIINMRLYLALLDSSISEHTARMLAMQTATDNADELLEEIKLHYNKLRQQAITSELLDIVGGTLE